MARSEDPPRPSIRATLERLGVVRAENIEIFATRTRDRDDVVVYRDKLSKVIFIDGYYVGEETYRSGAYRLRPKPSMSSVGRGLEDHADSIRRAERYAPFHVAKAVCDFGCGGGGFLRRVRTHAARVCGVELQRDFAEALEAEGIECRASLAQIEGPLDTVFMFHCLEHLPDPLDTLAAAREKLRSNGEGRIVIEVPHARDFLLDGLAIDAFKSFTLWSQHLVLHTRQSLEALLAAAGFKEIMIEGVQRYGLANHLRWLRLGKPGGHRDSLSILETGSLREAYADALSRLDANDTLVAVATA